MQLFFVGFFWFVCFTLHTDLSNAPAFNKVLIKSCRAAGFMAGFVECAT